MIRLSTTCDWWRGFSCGGSLNVKSRSRPTSCPLINHFLSTIFLGCTVSVEPINLHHHWRLAIQPLQPWHCDRFLPVSGMGIPSDDVVVIQKAKTPGEPCVITVNCPDKTGLGCDICRIILDFGLYIKKAGRQKCCISFGINNNLVINCVRVEASSFMELLWFQGKQKKA